MTSSEPAEHHSLLVTDFDGTMTRQDFYVLAARSLLPPDMPDYWAQYRAGQLTDSRLCGPSSPRSGPILPPSGRSWTGWSWIPIFPDAPPAQAVGLGRGRDLGGLRLVHSHPAR